MKDYERLTARVENKVIFAGDLLNTPNYEKAIIDRLAELEDKIESGKLVELPCKVGDPIYYTKYFCDYKGCSQKEQWACCGCKEMIEREKRKEKFVIVEKKFALSDLPLVEEKYFTTKEAAEAKLAELRGEK